MDITKVINNYPDGLITETTYNISFDPSLLQYMVGQKRFIKCGVNGDAFTIIVDTTKQVNDCLYITHVKDQSVPTYAQPIDIFETRKVDKITKLIQHFSKYTTTITTMNMPMPFNVCQLQLGAEIYGTFPPTFELGTLKIVEIIDDDGCIEITYE